jgi:tRNA A-37 threonylcarbamoyl transferase component Bud32
MVQTYFSIRILDGDLGVAAKHTARTRPRFGSLLVVAEAHVFGRYRVTGTLGAGGMGEVYAAVDEVLGREVAVKTLRGKHSGLAARLLDERFRQEARAIASLAHPGVVQVFDIDLTAEPPYIVMERVAGPSLKERIVQGALAINELRALGIQVSRALAAAHAAGIVHRDVKPANILSASGGNWKLADFGVAHVPDSAITMTGQFVGSPAYAPPEALVRGQTGPEGDIYGLGATLYEAAAGRWPRAEAMSGALLGPVPPLRSLAPQVPAEIADAIDRAVSVEPEARPTASDLADALAGASSTPGMRIATPAAGVPLAGFATPPAGVPLIDHSLPGHATPLPGIAAGPVAHDTPLPIPKQLPWKQIAIGVGIVLLIGTIAALSSRSPAPATVAGGPTQTEAPKPPEQTPEPAQPGELRVVTPEIATKDRRAGKDWNKLVEKLYEGKLEDAMKKLAEFERKWGESDETKSLHEQLSTLPARRDDD